jgi:hypothetical protein
MESLQDRFAPANRCFVAEWRPEPHHEAFDGISNGGIAALLDCHRW